MFRHPRGITALLACVAISAMILIATPRPASAQVIDKNFPIPLVNVGSGKCFSPTPQDGHFDWAGLLIQQRTCDIRLTTQFWIFVPLGFVPINDQGWFPCWGCIPAGTDGFFIKNDFTGLCMDARDGAKSDGSVVQQWTCRDKNARSMVWYIEPGDFPDALKRIRPAPTVPLHVEERGAEFLANIRAVRHRDGSEWQLDRREHPQCSYLRRRVPHHH
jgi:hypothetical protein